MQTLRIGRLDTVRVLRGNFRTNCGNCLHPLNNNSGPIAALGLSFAVSRSVRLPLALADILLYCTLGRGRALTGGPGGHCPPSLFYGGFGWCVKPAPSAAWGICPGPIIFGVPFQVGGSQPQWSLEGSHDHHWPSSHAQGLGHRGRPVKFPLGSQTEHSEHCDTQVMDFDNNNLNNG